MSVLTEIVRIQNAKSDVRDAIIDKGVRVPGSARVDTYSNYIEQITGGEVQESDVNFYDYDGTLLYAYDKETFAELTELPPNPTHPGLTAQGWNWTLADAKTYVTSNGCIDIGQNYVTDDGKTRIYYTAKSNTLTPEICFYQTVSNGVTIDWGDGSPTVTCAGANSNIWLPHSYEEAGDYVITMTCTSGTYQLGTSGENWPIISAAAAGGGTPYKYGISKIEIGAGCNGIRTYGVAYNFNLLTISIPTTVVNTDTYSLAYNYNLKAIVIPSGLSRIYTGGLNSLYQCKKIVLPKSVTRIDASAFVYLRAMKKLVIPAGVNFSGNYTFQYCDLEEIVIPDDCTCNGTYTFTECNLLKESKLISNALYRAQTFYNCRNLKSLNPVANVSDTSMGASVLYNCYQLEDFELPSTVTSLGNSAFYQCRSLKSLDISHVTSIGTQVFYGCTGLKDLYLPETPPTLSNTNAFSGIIGGLIMWVPTEASLRAYKTATNWSGFVLYMRVKMTSVPEEVEYLYSDGSTHTTTNLLATQIGKVITEMKYETQPSINIGDGCARTSTPAHYIISGILNKSGYGYGVQFAGGSNEVKIAPWDANWHTITLDVDNSTGQLDTDTPVSITTNLQINEYVYRIFKRNTGGTFPSYRKTIKFYDHSGNLIMDLMPCKVNGYGYFYDKISQSILAAVDGDYTCGPDIN